MKRTIVLLAMLGLVPGGASATILSFDTVTTGVLEASTDGSESNSCNDGTSTTDICALSLIFSNIGGTGINATVTANTAADGSGMDLWSWYDRSPADYGGMGAATQNEADINGELFDGDADNALKEYIIVTFSEAIFLDAFFLNSSDDDDNHIQYSGIAGLYLNGVATSKAICDSSLCDNDEIFGTTFAFLAGEPFYLGGLDFREFVDVPEPGVLALLGLGFGLIGVASRRRKKT
ncbi:MAG: PEP-CTERM sorting domain-containing protein [Gammaproteobacteria bacterium]|nr:PEP-CTERM sorting domain-containing protein [Gammaproteobacteria bacterium]